MLTGERCAAFEYDGLVRLRGADALSKKIREFLADNDEGGEHPGGFQPLKWAGEFAAIGDSSIPAALDDRPIRPAGRENKGTTEVIGTARPVARRSVGSDDRSRFRPAETLYG